MTGDVKEFIEHLSEKPWSMYTASDYSIEQWHAACLIHQHDGPPTSKSQCKLPIKTPNGAVNRNGVYSAAAALAGARGGVNASPEQKAAASRVLLRQYQAMGKSPPASLAQHSNIDNFIEHYGKKGMHWGIRNVPVLKKRTRKETQARAARQKILERRRQLSDSDVRNFVDRLNNEKKLKDLINQDLRPGRSMVKKILGDSGKQVVSRVIGTIAAGAALLGIKTLLEKKFKAKGGTPEEVAKKAEEAAKKVDMILRGGLKKKG